MVHVTNFLLRWLYINNLIRDRAEIQSLPQYPPHMQQIQHQQSGEWNGRYSGHDDGQQHSDSHPRHPPPSHNSAGPYGNTGKQQQQEQQQRQYYHQSAAPPYSTPTVSSLAATPPPGQPQHNGDAQHASAAAYGQDATHPLTAVVPPSPPSQQFQPQSFAAQQQNAHAERQQQEPQLDEETEWRHRALRYVAAYPPGVARLYALDGLRLELVHQLRRAMGEADEIGAGSATKGVLGDGGLKWGLKRRRAALQDDRTSINMGTDDQHGVDTDADLDADNGISQEFEAATAPEEGFASDEEDAEAPDALAGSNEEREEAAQSLRLESREYLPQLVAAVLHSPPPLTDASNLNPQSALRSLLVDRCLIDPNLGIELCWLLEAEVGRTWKTLFEHRQRTGRRLIVVLPAEKAAVLAKIGTEKKAAFDLLQDAEQGTAFGCLTPGSDRGHDAPPTGIDGDAPSSPPRLPASLSQRRCSHYGDTMHFLDQLTQVSLDLRRVPALQRMTYLKERLSELNRRLRRRMFTRGEISLDVEDNRGAYDWPSIKDINLDMLKYSVHFPLEPKSVTWPGPNDYAASDPSTPSRNGVMRVLNIVTDDARIMASRERCPFLVHLEVAETGLEGNDARLYASGVSDVSVTLEEAMGMRGSLSKEWSAPKANPYGFAPYRVPPELLSAGAKVIDRDGGRNIAAVEEGRARSTVTARGERINLPRGGQQGDGDYYYPPNAGSWDEYGVPSPYEMVRQEEIEQLHHAMQDGVGPQPPSQASGAQYMQQQQPQQRPVVSTGKILLDKVYGQPWEIRCRQIRKSSSYGKIKGWRLASFIMKAGEDIRREALVMQVISKMKGWFEDEIPEANRPYLRPYTIMCIGDDAGVVECVHDAKSVDEVKKQTDGYTSLRDFFERAFGPPGSSAAQSSPGDKVLSFEQAQDNFLRSLVGYSLVCYVLQIKDRHNANILMSREGHLMHIDFGFVLGDTPKMGKVPLFSERAPFKLTQEFWDVLGGWNFKEGGLGVKFCKMFEAAFACASAHADDLASLIEAAVLNLTWNANEAKRIGDSVRSRLRMRGSANSVRQKAFIMDLVEAALTSWGTSTYDWLQKSMNGYQ
mmetsp:Transcript_12485/g.26986  ORF Transcript_12485/g.26986 Transcript_12485/m.26986 type:complete len:1097 (+) Transcript_12485:435-3725(+)